MIGRLPKTLVVGGTEFEIRTDYRDCLLILQVFDDPDMSIDEMYESMLRILYYDRNLIKEEYTQEAVEKAIWFLNCGDRIEDSKKTSSRLYDWEQDEQMIFSAINKVACKEVRECEYVHFWTFISYFYEIGEGLFSTVMNIRSKKNKHKKLEKHEQEYWNENRSLCELKKKYTHEQKVEIDLINSLYT
ncbi:Gp15 family bacteriophage protein [Anaerosporobacter faecicola]|uniref:Gp15 family bacteriophage protein n=1 Tax=Anaerosporobacter faecicola TaxID=2718714 RepID=UPI001439D6D9|nr:Gp15 family bacteriophage protein [Anaerosporobacter faecicola]